MAMRREAGVQGDLVVTWSEMPRSPGHAFYDRLQKLLSEADLVLGFGASLNFFTTEGGLPTTGMVGVFCSFSSLMVLLLLRLVRGQRCPIWSTTHRSCVRGRSPKDR